MIASCQLNRLASKRRGGVLVLLAIMLPLLLLMSTYAINVAYVESVNTDVQIATDAAVQAAGRAYIETADENAALAAAQDAASRNPINGVTMPIVMRDLEFGISQRRNLSGRYNFTPVSGGALGNAVRMTTRSVNEAATPILKPIFPTMGTTLEIRPIRSAVSTQSTMDVALVIDRSGSMAYASDESSAGGMNPPRSAPPGWDFDQPVPPNARWLDMVVSVNEFAKYLRDSP
ncbi:MAG: pilus assembly protein TadG-related protein, partial [Planctomycetota bacterium]